jgi:folate-binding protein YgfZ
MGLLWLLGDSALGHLRFAGLGTVPDVAGHVTEGTVAGEPLLIGRPAASAPFAALLLGGAGAVAAAEEALLRGGAARGNDTDLRAARVLAGWPTLGAEIDEKTLPQEARFDEIEGVSYTKGCYVGQETVARLHFRGHANRLLRGLAWQGTEALAGSIVLGGAGKEVGQVRSTLQLPDRGLALAIIRREIEPGSEVVADGHPARVIALPFGEAEIAG